MAIIDAHKWRVIYAVDRDVQEMRVQVIDTRESVCR